MLNHFLWPIPFHTISSQAGLGSDIILTHALIFNLMASPPYSYTDMYGTQRALPLSENHEDQSITSGDPSLISYIPRAARSVPHAHTVHTIHVKKVTYYPLTSRLNYIIKMDWKRGAPLRPSWATFNSLRIPESYGRWQTSSIHYEVQPISSSSPAESLNPALPHPEHSNVQFGQPVSVIPDHTFILQSCWGRSAYHHLPSFSRLSYIATYIGPLLALHLRHHRPGCFCDPVLPHTWNRHLRYIILDLA